MTDHTIDEIVARLASLRAVHPDIDPTQWMMRMVPGYNIDYILDLSGKSNPAEIVECHPKVTTFIIDACRAVGPLCAEIKRLRAVIQAERDHRDKVVGDAVAAIRGRE